MNLAERLGKLLLGIVVDSTAEVLKDLLTITPPHCQDIGETELFGIASIEILKLGVLMGAALVQSCAGLFAGRRGGQLTALCQPSCQIRMGSQQGELCILPGTINDTGKGAAKSLRGVVNGR